MKVKMKIVKTERKKQKSSRSTGKRKGSKETMYLLSVLYMHTYIHSYRYIFTSFNGPESRIWLDFFFILVIA